jgi:hypothetical protein
VAARALLPVHRNSTRAARGPASSRRGGATRLAGFTLLALVAGAAGYAIELTRENPRGPGEMVGLTCWRARS